MKQHDTGLTHSFTPLRLKAPAITALSFTMDIAFSNSTYLQAQVSFCGQDNQKHSETARMQGMK